MNLYLPIFDFQPETIFYAASYIIVSVVVYHYSSEVFYFIFDYAHKIWFEGCFSLDFHKIEYSSLEFSILDIGMKS